MWPFNSSRIIDQTDDDMIGVNILVCGFCLFGSLILGSISGLNYLEFHNLEVNGESTNAVIVKGHMLLKIDGYRTFSFGMNLKTFMLKRTAR